MKGDIQMEPSSITFALIRSVIRRKAVCFLSLAVCILISGIPASAQEPHIVTFDAPGADTTTNDFNGTFATGMNNWGAVTGYYVDANNVYHGFLRSPEGKFITFEAPGADTTPGSFDGTSPVSINDLGAITGWYSDTKGFNHGFLRNPDGTFATFEVTGAGGYGSFPIGINVEGAIVGYYTDPNVNFHAFLRTPDGKFKTFAGPGACETGTSTGCYGNEATIINFSGTSVGNYMDENFVGHGLIRGADGALTTFEAPGGGTGIDQGTGCPGCYSGFNQWGAIATNYTDANNVFHGLIRSPNGKLTTFDAPDAGTGSYQGTGCFSDCPVSLNDWGVITGVYVDSNYVYHGYLRTPAGKIVTIDPSGSTGTFPYVVNDLGEITGYYLDGNGVWHGFQAIP
jgi:hypothetical protein